MVILVSRIVQSLICGRVFARPSSCHDRSRVTEDDPLGFTWRSFAQVTEVPDAICIQRQPRGTAAITTDKP